MKTERYKSMFFNLDIEIFKNVRKQARYASLVSFQNLQEER